MVTFLNLDEVTDWRPVWNACELIKAVAVLRSPGQRIRIFETTVPDQVLGRVTQNEVITGSAVGCSKGFEDSNESSSDSS